MHACAAVLLCFGKGVWEWDVRGRCAAGLGWVSNAFSVLQITIFAMGDTVLGIS